MSEFYPGLEVVCVDASEHRDWPANAGVTVWNVSLYLKEGAHYVVRWTGTSDGESCVRLEGVIRETDESFFARRFRPVRRETIEQFRAMCRSKKPLVPVGID